MAKPGQPACPVCGGNGFVWQGATPAYPDGSWRVCGCLQRALVKRRLAEIMRRSGLDEATMARWSFETFRPTLARGDAAAREGLARAKEACEAFAREPRGWLVLAGPYGCGKSHLAYATAAAVYRRGASVLVSTVPDLLESLRQGIAEGGGESFDARFAAVRDAELLVLDDLGAQQDTPWGAEKLYQIVDFRLRRRLPLIVTTNVNLYEPRGRLEPRLLSRLLEGANLPDGFSQVFLIAVGDYRTRPAAGEGR